MVVVVMALSVFIVGPVITKTIIHTITYCMTDHDYVAKLIYILRGRGKMLLLQVNVLQGLSSA